MVTTTTAALIRAVRIEKIVVFVRRHRRIHGGNVRFAATADRASSMVMVRISAVCMAHTATSATPPAGRPDRMDGHAYVMTIFASATPTYATCAH